jgi:hypothetical protein
MRRNRLIAIVISACSIGLLFGSLFLYLTDSPILHQSNGDVMTVEELNTGFTFWGFLWVGKTVTVEGIFEPTHFVTSQEHNYDSYLKDFHSNTTIGIMIEFVLNRNITLYEQYIGRSIAVYGQVTEDDQGIISIRAEKIPLVLNNLLGG